MGRPNDSAVQSPRSDNGRNSSWLTAGAPKLSSANPSGELTTLQGSWQPCSAGEIHQREPQQSPIENSQPTVGHTNNLQQPRFQSGKQVTDAHVSVDTGHRPVGGNSEAQRHGPDTSLQGRSTAPPHLIHRSTDPGNRHHHV